MKTPYFLIHKALLDRNIADFQSALSQYWPNYALSYSVKTNSLPGLLQYLNKKNLFAEVVSDEEYRLAETCGFCPNRIVFNGPIKGERTLCHALKGQSYVNVDSWSDVENLRKYCPEGARVGIRVNLPVESFRPQDVGYIEDGFRFGFSDKNGDFLKVLDTVNECCKDAEIGLHLHCNSITRSVNVYSIIAQYAADLVRKYRMKIRFVDIGGGFFGGVDGKPTAFDYLKTIRDAFSNVLSPNDTTLIVEPGSAIIGSVVDYNTSVVDVKNTPYGCVITTDGSRIHIDPFWKKDHYLFSTDTKETLIADKQIICGYTCMDHDRLMIVDNAPQLRVGDHITYHRVGAYTMTMAGMFIRYLPEVYFDDGDSISMIRSNISDKEYISVQS